MEKAEERRPDGAPVAALLHTETERRRPWIVVERPKRPLKPKQCERYMKQVAAEALPDVMEGFLNVAAKGSCTHMRILLEMLREPAVVEAREEMGYAERLLQELGGD